jgi:hypothetical protein
MPFTDRLKALLDDPKVSPYFRKTNNESGPAGPLNIEKARDWEITWENGRAKLLQTPRVATPQGENMDKKRSSDSSWNRGGSNTGTLPDDPNAPLDKIAYKNKDRKITEENMSMSYVERLAVVLSKAASLTFQDVLKLVKRIFPELKMQFPKPPTYVWNPEEEGEGGEEGGDTETEAPPSKLDPQAIKDKLKVRLPQLKWTTRMFDGVEEAELGFDDGAMALFEIGVKANHLTLTYTEAKEPQVPEVKYDDSTGDEEDATP